MLTQFDEQAQKAIVVSESIAFDMGHSHVGSEHLLLSMLKMPECKLKDLLNVQKIDDQKIEEDIKRLFGIKDNEPFYMEYSDAVKEILQKSISLIKEKGKNKVTLSCLSLALLQTKECVAYELLKKYHVEIDELIVSLNENSELETKLDQISMLVNLNQKVKKLNYQIIGREKEINQLCTILSKKEKNNVLIVGEAGVGKSALVEKLAQKINQKEVPDTLKHKLIYELSLSSLVAGTKYRGEFEEKLKKVIDKVKDTEQVIIFIDEIHNIIGAGGAEGAIDASNILKPYLARDEITVIGATTLDEYYRHFEHDQAMNRRFSLITIKENTKEETKDILLGIKSYYEKYHHLTITPEILDYLVNQVDLYIKNRTYPDKAIDILDLSCVKAKFNHLCQLNQECINRVIEDYASIKMDESIDYHHLQQQLNQKIIGQEKAISKIVKQLKIKKESHQPQAVFLFSGSSGVGKSETAKQLAKILDRHLIRLDMSQYKEISSLQKIIGAPPGYVGYERPSLLLPQLQSYPKSILLLDEIEKAHPDILQLFLQVFDEGYLEDNQKRKVYFNQTMIIMTTYQNNDIMMGFKKQHHQKVNPIFTHEFINRIDEIVPFQLLSDETLSQIVKKEYALDQKQINELLKDYSIYQGARQILKQAKKLIHQHS